MSCHSQRGRLPAVLVEECRAGLRLELEAEVPVGSPIWVGHPWERPRSGQVRWSRGGEAGVALLASWGTHRQQQRVARRFPLHLPVRVWGPGMPATTCDLSVEGASLLLSRSVPLPPTCRITFDPRPGLGRQILDCRVVHHHERLVRVQFLAPAPELARFLESRALA